MTQVIRIPDWWRETTNKGIKCIERTYSWLEVYGTFRYYPSDESLVLELNNPQTVAIYPKQSSIFEMYDHNIDTYCMNLLRETWHKVTDKT